jgi:Holliday junction resolvase YEN1
MHETQAVFFHHHHSQMGENPELRLLFYRLSNILKMAMIPVFVFDGSGRPSVKRGKKVSALPHWMTERFREFIDAFGFHAHTVSHKCSFVEKRVN